ncbi:MAG: DNA-3-methyladenine glycosylase family protein [Lachnospiraceae bacterium]
MYFQYDESATEYLKQKDKRLAEVIDRIGKIEREVDSDLFSSVVHHIIGQQISTKAQATIWQRMQENLGAINADTILAAGTDRLQSFGMTFKTEYITNFAVKVQSGAFDLEGIWDKTDDEAISELSSLKGIGVWTAEMILLFVSRPNVFSYGDLAVLRGMRMVYHHRKIDRKLFEKYRRRLSPIAVWRACTFGGSRWCDTSNERLRSQKENIKMDEKKNCSIQNRDSLMTAIYFWCENNEDYMPTGLPCKNTIGKEYSIF